MESISMFDININSESFEGGFSDNYKCKFNNEEYMFKKYEYPDQMISKFFIDKMDEISKLSSILPYVPRYWVKAGNEKIGYLTKIHDGKDLGLSTNIGEIAVLLKEAKEQLILMHDIGLIHGDIHYCNIMYSDESTDFIDYDNSSYLNFNPDATKYSLNAFNFAKTFGISKELDVFLFNKMTFELINDLDGNREVEKNIRDKEYGIFTDKESKKICRALILEGNPSTEFLIDSPAVKKLVRTR